MNYKERSQEFVNKGRAARNSRKQANIMKSEENIQAGSELAELLEKIKPQPIHILTYRGYVSFDAE